jgi:chromosome segregation ATPase
MKIDKKRPRSQAERRVVRLQRRILALMQRNRTARLKIQALQGTLEPRARSSARPRVVVRETVRDVGDGVLRSRSLDARWQARDEALARQARSQYGTGAIGSYTAVCARREELKRCRAELAAAFGRG